MKGSEGFTLIEAMVALIVLGAGVLALFQLLSASTFAARRAESAALADDKRRNALELAAALNPMEQPNGSLDLGAYRIRWVSSLTEGPARVAGNAAGAGLFTAALYKLTFDFPDDPSVAPVTLTKMGWRRDRVLGLANPN